MATLVQEQAWQFSGQQQKVVEQGQVDRDEIADRAARWRWGLYVFWMREHPRVPYDPSTASQFEYDGRGPLAC